MRGGDAGARAWVVTIEGAVDGTDAAGFPIRVWTPIVVIPAKRSQSSAAEVYAATGEVARIVVVWETNYRADCDPDRLDVAKDRRVVYRGRIHDVISADVVGPGLARISWATVAATAAA